MVKRVRGGVVRRVGEEVPGRYSRKINNNLISSNQVKQFFKSL